MPCTSRWRLPRLHATGLALVAVCLVILPSAIRAQSPEEARRTLRAHRLLPETEIDLDGRLRETAWSRADSATDFVQQEPDIGAPATEPTAVRIVYDADHLYLGVLLRDSRPDGILGYKRQRDAGLNTDDRFMWILDTFLDGRTAYFFEINPAGLMGDGLMGAGFNKSWDGRWEAHVARGAYGWSAEIRIPFSTLNFDPDLDTWGINFQRTVRRKNEESLWEGHRPNQGLFNPTYAGRLANLEGLSQGLGLEVRPYGLASWQGETGTGESGDFTGDAGFDVSYSFTPGLRGAVTVNTDFAEVEVDRRRVNLTRFPLRFPEKRDFFLENSDVYNFAPRNDQEPYFSRRIGLVEGEEVPIEYGVRLGGQVRPYEVGFLQVRTGSSPLAPAEDFTVARVKRRLFEASSIGVIYTRRATEPGGEGPGSGGIGGDGTSPAAPPDRHTLGADLLLFTSSFLGDRNLRGQAFAVWHSPLTHDAETTFGDRSSRGLRVSYPNDIWDAHVSYREFGEHFDPPVGFVRRNGFRRLQPSLSYNPRPEGLGPVRQLHHEIRFEDLRRLSDNELLTRDLSFQLLGVEFDSGDGFELGIGWNTERLERPFEIHDGVEIPTGRYDNFGWSVGASTADHRRLAASVELARGGFWSGDRTRVEGSLTVRPAVGLSAAAEVSRTDVDLPQGAFTAEVYRLQTEWHPTPWLALTENLQFDNRSDLVGLQARLRWIVEPGSDFFLVYTHNWRSLGEALFDPRLETLSQQGATKLAYSVSF